MFRVGRIDGDDTIAASSKRYLRELVIFHQVQDRARPSSQPHPTNSNSTIMSMGISYSTAKWLVGLQAVTFLLSYADLLERRQQASSSTLQPSSMVCFPRPTCWTSTMRTCRSGAPCLTSLAASSFPSSCSSSHGSIACTSLIPRSQPSVPSWIRLVGFR